jgi:hypothetical protein
MLNIVNEVIGLLRKFCRIGIYCNEVGMFKRFIIFLLLSFFSVYGVASEPPPTGNYILPGSQQPGPLFSFGQYTINQYQSQLFMNPYYTRGFQQSYLSFEPSFIYGVTDNLSLLLSTPFAARYYESPNRSSGLTDSEVHLEYAFYNSSTNVYQDQATVVGGVSIPTGSARKLPNTGIGSSSLFLGLTYNKLYVDWYWFLSPGATYVLPNHDSHIGSYYYYQAGLGRNLLVINDSAYWLALVELDGAYYDKNKQFGRVDRNSGGNSISIAPSLLFATKRVYTQFGVSIYNATTF